MATTHGPASTATAPATGEVATGIVVVVMLVVLVVVGAGDVVVVDAVVVVLGETVVVDALELVVLLGVVTADVVDTDELDVLLLVGSAAVAELVGPVVDEAGGRYGDEVVSAELAVSIDVDALIATSSGIGGLDEVVGLLVDDCSLRSSAFDPSRRGASRARTFTGAEPRPVR